MNHSSYEIVAHGYIERGPGDNGGGQQPYWIEDCRWKRVAQKLADRLAIRVEWCCTQADVDFAMEAKREKYMSPLDRYNGIKHQ